MTNKSKRNYFDTIRKKMSMGEGVSDRLITMAVMQNLRKHGYKK